MIQVNQGVQIRSFAYDSLSRLRTATNPESGLMQYSYDPNGNMIQKIDARNVVTSYVY
jgi:YD repeat-containing protein